MDMFLNIGLAKISTGLAIIMSAIYVLRVINKKVFNNEKNFLYSLNRVLRKHHKTLGIILVIIGLVHGIYSSDSVLSFNWGTVAWVFSLLLGLNWMLRKKLKTKKIWIYYHRILTVLFLLTMVIHIAVVKDVFNSNSEGFNQSTSISESADSNDLASKIDNDDTAIENNNEEIENSDGSSLYNDGTYYGEANGYRPNLNVEVIIEDGMIQSVEVTDNNETPKFLRRVVPTLTDDIVETQKTDVDTITRATMTSDAIIEATNEALEDAK
ncbi:FMN-binding protein [Clostridium sp. DL1XJH146]